MFHCGICGNVSEPGEWPEMVVLQKRRVTYNIKREFQGKVRLPKFIKTKEIPVEVEKKGWEIVKEVPACSVCAAKPTRVQTVDPPIVRLIKETIVDTRKVRPDGKLTGKRMVFTTVIGDNCGQGE